MSGHATLALQTAIFTALNTALATAGPSGAAVPVKDHVVADQATPYVVLGETSAEPFDTTTEVGQETRMVLHVYTALNRGKKDCYALLKKIYDALHQQSLSLGAGVALVFLYHELEDVLLDSDGLTFHGLARYRAVTTEA